MTKRILFTGGTGKAGRHVVPYLRDRGYRVLNFDLNPSEHADIPTLVGDITDGGQVMNAMTTHFGFDGLRAGAAPGPVDAVVHFAAIPRILIRPDDETFRVNVMGTYTVIEAAMKLGIRKVVIASSETTYGVCFAEGDKDFHSFPLEEDYDTDPMDSYGLSKVVNEKTARAFAMRFGADIYALRIGNVIEPHEYTRFPGFVADPPSRKRNAWSYIDARDLGQIVHLCLAEGRARLPGVQRGERQHHRRAADGGVPQRNTARTCRSPARSKASRHRSRTARSAACSASARSTIGGTRCCQARRRADAAGSSARSTAASAWIAVVSNSGTALSSGRTSSMISVQPRMTASAPRATRRAITSR